MKICTKCGLPKDDKEFYLLKNRTENKQYKYKAYKDKPKKNYMVGDCKECRAKIVSEKRNNNYKYYQDKWKKAYANNPQAVKDRTEKYRLAHPGKREYMLYEKRAKKKGYSFTITEEQFKNIVYLPCHYCGIEPKDRKWKVNGIDRKDSSIGYELSNCLPCCGTCNTAKLLMSYDEFIGWVLRAAKNISIKLSKEYTAEEEEILLGMTI